MAKFANVLFASLLIIALMPIIIFAQEPTEKPQKVIISEIKIDGSGTAEYVEIYNLSDQIVDLTNWKLEYAKPGFDKLNCGFTVWSNFLNGLETALPAQALDPASELKINRSMTDSLGGSVRITDANAQVHDLVGWDNGASGAPCLDDQLIRSPAPWANDNQSIQRYLDCETNIPVDTNNNGTDFLLSSTPGQFINNCPIEEPEEEPELPQINSCYGTILTEVLPNPEGADTGQEFIELFNTTNLPIKLAGCQLQTSANSKIYTFEGEQLNPGEYRAFSDDKTGLTLANSSGGSVYLIDVDSTEIDQLDYPANLEDNQVWAKYETGWGESYSPTPNAANQLLSVKPCPSGQTRNDETNRCVNEISSANTLASCKPGQERNPETNRCRNIASLASVLKPCDPGQVRNPETNRCKKADSSSLVPCREGQERNPETNRCRNAAGVLSGSDISKVNDVASPASNTGWKLAGIGIIGAIFYAVWEWRNELMLKMVGLKKALASA